MSTEPTYADIVFKHLGFDIEPIPTGEEERADWKLTVGAFVFLVEEKLKLDNPEMLAKRKEALDSQDDPEYARAGCAVHSNLHHARGDWHHDEKQHIPAFLSKQQLVHSPVTNGAPCTIGGERPKKACCPECQLRKEE